MNYLIILAFFEVIYVPREQNSRADILSKLTSTKKPSHNRMLIQETLVTPSIEVEEKNIIEVAQSPGWMVPMIRYLTIKRTTLRRVEGKEDSKPNRKVHTNVHKTL